jgi:two-component system LytT family sensor kinase
MLNRILSRSGRSFWLLQTAGWLGYFALSLLIAIGYGKPWTYCYVLLATTSFGFVMTALLRSAFRQVWLWPPAQRWSCVAGLLFLAAWVLGVFNAEALFRFCMDCRPGSFMGYIGYFGSTLYVLLSWSGLYFGIKFSREIAFERETALQATAMAHQAQLKMLRYQLNPHFLFNTLNAISTLILDNQNGTANRMLSGLSTFLRHSLDSDPMQRVTLGEELGALTRYLAIEQLRFGERLRVYVNASAEARVALVPSLILQPLIENCIKYAIAKRIEGGSISIAAEVRQDALVVAVRDDGPGLPTQPGDHGCGVGLTNIRERLRVLYGSAQEVRVQNLLPKGLEVQLTLPFEPASVAIPIESTEPQLATLGVP